MTKMSAADASNLYDLLDEHVGMFKFPHMSEAAKIFCQRKRHEFLDAYTTSIPEVFWFQGDGCSSAELVHNPDTNSFHVVSEVDCVETRVMVEALNKALYRKHFRHA